MNSENLLGEQKWRELEREYQMEQRVYDMTLKALKVIKYKLGDIPICAFAFCADGYFGDLTLAYHIYDGEVDGDVLKENYRYPSEWSHEMDSQLEELVDIEFRNIIGDRIYQLQEQSVAEGLGDNIAEAYLNSLRRVMKRLEDDKAFDAVSTSQNLWLVVTEVDSDTKEEAHKLREVRSLTVKSI